MLDFDRKDIEDDIITCEHCGASFKRKESYCNFLPGTSTAMYVQYYCRHCNKIADLKLRATECLTPHEVTQYINFRMAGPPV